MQGFSRGEGYQSKLAMSSLLNGEYADKLHDLLKYLSSNIEYLVNYELRKASKLPYTSSVIESTIETGVDSVCIATAITLAKDPEKTTKSLSKYFNN